ncbi:MAG: hypothetical protein FJY88_00050 [Candidatus Eisenbacteria bacterium]|nr:hypothetical protein [Candidatus Eisenbacteria bacterium]
MSAGWGGKRTAPGKFAPLLEKFGPPGSVLLAGPEVLIRDQMLALLRRSVLGQEADSGRWSRETYQARELPLGQLTSGLRVVGLFGDARLVVVTEVERYGRSGKADREEFWRCLDSPSPGVHLVLTSEKPLWELERASEFVKGTLSRVDAVIPLDHPGHADGVALAQKLAQERHGLSLPEDAARRLVDAVGPNLMEISNEIDRLALRLGSGAKVTDEDLRSWLRSGIAGSLADLEQAVLGGDVRLALRYWAAVRPKFAPAAVTWMMGSKFLDARWGRGGGEGGRDPRAVLRLLRECYGLERAIKRGEIASIVQETAFETMLARVCRAEGTARKGE